MAESLERTAEAKRQLEEALANAAETLEKSRLAAKKRLDEGLAEAQKTLQDALVKAQQAYQEKIDEIAKATEKKLADLRAKLAEVAALIAALGAAQAAAAAMANAPVYTGGGGGGASAGSFSTALAKAAVIKKAEDATKETTAKPVVGTATYYADKAATLVGTIGYQGMTAAEIANERSRESGNRFAVTVNATTNASPSAIANSVVAAQKYGQAVTVSRGGGSKYGPVAE
jgi:phage shock protein A